MNPLFAINNKLKKSVAIILIAVTLITPMSGCSSENYSNSNNTPTSVSDDIESLTNAAKKITESNTDKTDGMLSKEETVYVKADANGKVKNIVVSDWLKNAGNYEQIKDKSDLNNITNIKGDETYTKNPDGSITWETSGKDIYYQGTPTRNLPITVNISYKLNEKNVTAEEIKGKNGKMEMNITYTNTAKNENTIIPFTVATAMALPEDKFTNVEVNTGTVISDGSNNVVLGLAFPGLNSELGFTDKNLDITIPETVTITANVTNFEIGPTITAASNGVINKIGLDEIESFDSLDTAIQTLTSATSQLVSGALSAKDGSFELLSGTNSLNGGINTLQNGVKQYTDGVSSATDGSVNLTNGVETLNSGAVTLNDGMAALNNGVITLNDGASTLNSGTQSINNGAFTLASKIADSLPSFSQLSKGIGDYTKGVSSVNTGINELIKNNTKLSNGANSLVSGLTAAQNGIAALTEGVSSLRTGANKIVSGYAGNSGAAHGAKTLADGSETLSDGITALINKVSDMSDEIGVLSEKYLQQGQSITTYQELLTNFLTVKVVSGTPLTVNDTDVINTYVTAIAQCSSATGAGTALANVKNQLDDPTLQKQLTLLLQGSLKVSNGAEALNIGINGENGDPLNPSPTSLYGGTKALYEGIAILKEKIEHQQQSDSDTPGLQEAIDKLVEGSKTLSKGVSNYTDGTNKLAIGIGTLTANNDTLNNGAAQLVSGGNQFSEGAGTLANGTTSLATGATTLYNGTTSLLSATNTLSNGTNSFLSGTNTLFSGTQTLRDGLKTLRSKNNELNSGLTSLSSGGQQLSNGVSQLSTGLGTLYSGLSEFKTTGIDKISSLYNNDFKEFQNKTKLITDADKSYNNFSGINNDDMSGKVSFIIETSSISNS